METEWVSYTREFKKIMAFRIKNLHEMICKTSNPLLTHFLTQMTARGCDRMPEMAKFVAYYRRYKLRNIRDYGQLFEITSD